MCVHLRVDRFHTLCRRRGWHTRADQARRIGIARVTLHRLVAGTQEPRTSTIEAMLAAFELEFAELFEMRDSPR